MFAAVLTGRLCRGLGRFVCATAIVAGVTSGALAAATTKTFLRSSHNSIKFGQTITLRALVTSGFEMNSGGGVLFKEGGNFLSGGTLSSPVYSVASRSIAAGEGFACVVTGMGSVECSGYGPDGQLGDGNASTIFGPNTVLGVSDVVAVSAGAKFACSLSASGTVSCWGDNDPTFQQLGRDTSPESKGVTAGVVTGLATDIVQISAGINHACALRKGGTVQCWGHNGLAQRGTGGTSGGAPNEVVDLSGVIEIAAGGGHTCALINDGNVKCWGNNGSGQVGNDGVTNDGQSVFAPVTVLGNAVSIAAGAFHTCAVLSSGAAQCWGYGGDGELGTGDFNSSPVPVTVVDEGVSYRIVWSGSSSFSTCGLSEISGPRCWGLNSNGMLGNGHIGGIASVPMAKTLTDSINNAALSSNFSCAVYGIGGVYCWGSNSTGQFGNGNTGTTNASEVRSFGPSGFPMSFMEYTYTKSNFTLGTHTVTAHYGGDALHDPSVSDPVSFDIDPSEPTFTSASSGTFEAGTAGSFTLTTGGAPVATIAQNSGTLPGGLSFADNGDGTATISGTPGAGTGGTYNLGFTASNGTPPDATQNFTLTVNEAPAVTSASSTSRTVGVAGSAFTIATSGFPAPTLTPTGSLPSGVSFTDLGNGTATLSGTAALGTVGDYPITITAANGVGTDATQNFTLSVTKILGTMVLSPSASTIQAGGPVTFTANAFYPVAGVSGTVTFADGATSLGTEDFSGSAQASRIVSNLSVGTHTVTANYPGDDNFNSISGSTNVTVKATSGPQEARANSHTTGAQQFPAIALLANNTHIVVWASNAQDGSKYGVYGQLYRATGAKLGDEIHISTAETGNQTLPKVAATKGGFVVVWQSENQDGSKLGVYGRNFRLTGAPSGREFKVNTFTNNDQSQPTVARLADGGYVVAWTSNGQDKSGVGIYAQRYDDAAKPDGVEFRVNTTTAGAQSAPTAAGTGNGGFVIGWQAPDANGLGIFAQRYNAAGRKQGAQFAVNGTLVNDQSMPSVAGTEDRGFVFVWQSNLQDGSGLGIFGQRFAASGVKVGPQFRANTMTANDQSQPRVSAFSDDGFVVVWTSGGQDGAGTGVYAQVFRSSGSKVNVEFRANATTTGNQSQPAVAAGADGKFMGAWTSRGAANTLEDVFVQQFRVLWGG